MGVGSGAPSSGFKEVQLPVTATTNPFCFGMGAGQVDSNHSNLVLVPPSPPPPPPLPHDDHLSSSAVLGQSRSPDSTPLSPKENSWVHIALRKPLERKTTITLLQAFCEARGILSIKSSISVAMDGKKLRESCLVGSFLEKKPHFHIVQAVAIRMWKKYNLSNIMMNDKAFFFFKFESAPDMHQCLEDSPWLFQN
ncbi:hypothetical protein Patl1_05618 [Pistacia atlantica]|uniref:Uncharacterized protein n=1 Tax=Pistacia atlantica TaxID=434234 RepID=A0ACC1BSL9_9ROSI|nr:hypothetical protein Patl1_05618 [Pistacia atlantica]